MQEKPINPEELQVSKLNIIPVDPTELEVEEKIMEGVDEIVPDELPEADDLDKKNYYKVSPTFYIQAVESEELDEEGEKIELFKILNPETNVVETRVLTDEEKKELFIAELKRSQKKFNPLSHPTQVVRTETVTSPIGRKLVRKERELQTNITVNKFGASYRKKRQNRNLQTS